MAQVFDHGQSPFGSNWFYYNTQLEQIKSFLQNNFLNETFEAAVYMEKAIEVLKSL
ncbi:hypothetical protein CHCC20335_3509 [Bacillus paralicheniformis]|nr:hypothetical protein CHCC20335_3509 [Bacillus paralicheniformis]